VLGGRRQNAWPGLNHAAADFQLYTLDERSEELAQVDFSRYRQPGFAAGSCVPGGGRYRALQGRNRPSAGAGSPAARERVEVRPTSATETGLFLHGLGIRARPPRRRRPLLARVDQVSFGAGANETPLTEENEGFAATCARGSSSAATLTERTPTPCSACNRKRWLEARLRAGIAELLPGLRRRPALCPSAGALDRRPRAAGPAHAGPQRAAGGDRAPRPTRICICRAKRWTTGFACAP